MGSLAWTAPGKKLASVAARPLNFEPDSPAGGHPGFIAHGPNFELKVRPSGIGLVLGTRAALAIEFINANRNAAIDALDRKASESNYLLGPDPSEWRTHVPNFGRIKYSGIYPGIDLLFYGDGETLEHDFVLAPGADPHLIRMRMQGQDKISIAQDGGLRLTFPEGDLVFHTPNIYQETPLGRITVRGRFSLFGKTEVGFAVAKSDPSLPLVIDPVLTYSTYLAGSGQDHAYAVAADRLGNGYVTGTTVSSDFPTKSAFQPACDTNSFSQSCADIFITKIDPTGLNVIYSTYIGGNGADSSSAIAVDTNGNAIIAGLAGSSDFPTLHSYTTYSGFTNEYAFILSLSADGSHLNYSSLLGEGGILNTELSVAVDQTGEAYLTGQTDDSQFPITANTLGTSFPGYPYATAFITKLGTDGTVLYSTPIPGTLPLGQYGTSGDNFIPNAIAVDSSGAVYIGGEAGPGLPTNSGTISPSFPGDPTNYQVNYGFVLKVNPAASAVDYATYLPYTASVSGVALDPTGDLYVTGLADPGPISNSNASFITGFPTTSGAFQSKIPPGKYCACNAGFVAELAAGATSYAAATYLTGTPTTSNQGTTVQSLAIDSGGNIWVAGVTDSPDYPLKYPVVSNSPANAPQAGFITELKVDLSADLFSTFFNGQNGLYHTSNLNVAPVQAGVIFAAGSVDDSDFPTTSGSYEPNDPTIPPSLVTHAFFSEIDATVPAASACLSATQLNFPLILINTTSAAQTITIQNCGNADLHIQSVTIPGAAFSQTNTCASAISPGVSCSIAVTFSPIAILYYTQTMTILNDTALGVQRVSLSGTVSQPQITLILSQHSFGDLLVGTSGAPVGILLVTGGNGNLIITNVAVTGDFSVTNNCTNPLPPKSLCFLYVTFSPVASGTRTGTLTLTDNAPNSSQSVQLTGNGITSYPAPSISSLKAMSVSSNGVVLQIAGNYFFPASTVQWNGSPRTVTYVSESLLTVTLSSSDLSAMVGIPVTVTNPPPGGGMWTATFQNPGLLFVPVTPCRIADTRGATGPFGGPTPTSGSTHSFTIPNSACGIPSTAAAYSLNATVVPQGPLSWLTMWPTGQQEPVASTLNSFDGRIKANAAIVPAGTGGAISVFVTNTTDVILDINGYFVLTTSSTPLAFYPLTPCRVVDTRFSPAPLAGPSMTSGQTRTFPVRSSSCNVPSIAQAYSLNFTVVPQGPLSWLTVWPTGQTEPVVSTLNAPTGAVTANAAIVPAGLGGSIDGFVTDNTDLIIDINGYFAPPGPGGLSFYPLTPCRVLDTRLSGSEQPLSGELDVNVTGSACSPPSAAQAYVFNTTVVPSGG